MLHNHLENPCAIESLHSLFRLLFKYFCPENEELTTNFALEPFFVQLLRKPQQGYHGSSASLYTYIRCLRKGVSLKDAPLPAPVRQRSAKQVRFLFLRHPTDLKPEEQKDLDEILLRHTDLTALYQLVQQFQSLMHARRPQQLDAWVQQVVKTSFSELHHFVSGLRKDWDAVQATFTVEWSNGMVEGQVNRLKLLKRQMYGRANFDLLRLRVLHRDEVSHTKCA